MLDPAKHTANAGDAFDERAWIVVAEFEAPESEAELALAAQTALGRGPAAVPFVLLSLAELEESRGNTDAAVAHYRRFLELWSDPEPEV